MTNVPNGVETLLKISTGCVGCTNVSDDRQTTDERATAYSERSLKSGKWVSNVGAVKNYTVLSGRAR